MWTIIYQENGKDKWDRLESKDDVKNLLKTLRNDPGVCFEDVWIFTPDADDNAIEPNDLLFDNALLTMLSNCLRTQGYSFTDPQLKELYGIYTDCQKWDEGEILTGLTCDEVTDFVENSTCVKDILFKQHDDVYIDVMCITDYTTKSQFEYVMETGEGGKAYERDKDGKETTLTHLFVTPYKEKCLCNLARDAYDREYKSVRERSSC